MKTKHSTIKTIMWESVFCILVILVSCSEKQPKVPRDDFEPVLGIPLAPELVLGANRTEINPYEPVVLVARNYSHEPIMFPDEDLGIRAFKFNTENSTWTPVSVIPPSLHPRPFTMAPADTDSFSTPLILPPELLSDKGKLRFVIVGSTDPNRAEDTKVAAYTDVYIHSENPTFFGNWTKANNLLLAEPDDTNTFVTFAFEGDHVTMLVEGGPTYGALRVQVEGMPAEFRCLNNAIPAENKIEIKAQSAGMNLLRVYPITRAECNSGSGRTGIIGFESR